MAAPPPCPATSRSPTAAATPARRRSACCWAGSAPARRSITLRMYAERKQWPLGGADVELSYIVVDRSTRWIDRKMTLRGPLDDDQRATLAGIAEKTPVTNAVRAGTEIRTTFR